MLSVKGRTTRLLTHFYFLPEFWRSKVLTKTKNIDEAEEPIQTNPSQEFLGKSDQMPKLAAPNINHFGSDTNFKYSVDESAKRRYISWGVRNARNALLSDRLADLNQLLDNAHVRSTNIQSWDSRWGINNVEVLHDVSPILRKQHPQLYEPNKFWFSPQIIKVYN